ncbi:MAG: hypothetical protein GY751_06930, partial [Bacteroidetes bacterium]|nr:hypothetical protein [Bacteroidota bacterium]
CFVKYHIHDLAEIFSSLINLKIKYCAGTPGGHCKGDTAYFYVSEDEETWTLIGQENVPERAGINDIIHTKDYNPSTSFRYVKVYIPECYNDWSSAEALMKGNNGYSYEVFIDTEVTWHQAKAIAEDMGGYLATITSAEEQQFIEDLLISSGAPTGAYWFGLVETGTEGIYTWDNGESLSYTNWDNNQPDNYQGADSGQILWTVEPEAHTFNRRGKWDDVLSEGIKESLHYPDLDRRGYIVESQPTECIEDDSGSIDITGKAGPCGGKLTIPVRIQDAPATANSIGFDVAFDSGVLIYTGFARGELAEPFDFFNVTEVSDGLVRCGGFKTEELAEGSEGNLLYLQFDVSAKCHDSKLELRELKDDISTWTASHGCFSMK